MVLFTVMALLKADISYFTRARTYFFSWFISFLKALSFPSVAHYSNLEAILGKDGATWFLEKNPTHQSGRELSFMISVKLVKNTTNNKCGSTCSRAVPCRKMQGVTKSVFDSVM